MHLQLGFLLHDLQLHVHKMKVCPDEKEGRNAHFPVDFRLVCSCGGVKPEARG